MKCWIRMWRLLGSNWAVFGCEREYCSYFVSYITASSFPWSLFPCPGEGRMSTRYTCKHYNLYFLWNPPQQKVLLCRVILMCFCSSWISTSVSRDEGEFDGCKSRTRFSPRVGPKKAEFTARTEKLRRKCQGKLIVKFSSYFCFFPFLFRLFHGQW